MWFSVFFSYLFFFFILAPTWSTNIKAIEIFKARFYHYSDVCKSSDPISDNVRPRGVIAFLPKLFKNVHKFLTPQQT